MKRFLVVVCAVAVCLSAATANAQTAVPFVQVYFDEGWSVTNPESCPLAPAGTLTGTLYVVARNWNIWMQSIEYAIEYPPELVWLGDIVNPATQLKLGDSPTTSLSGGIAVTWRTRGNAFQPLLIQKASILWNCEGCFTQNITLRVVKHPSTAWPENWLVRGLESPTFAEVQGVGMASVVCPTVPVEETTWGGIKAQYGN
jgi:hypothetical protein